MTHQVMKRGIRMVLPVLPILPVANVATPSTSGGTGNIPAETWQNLSPEIQNYMLNAIEQGFTYDPMVPLMTQIGAWEGGDLTIGYISATRLAKYTFFQKYLQYRFIC